MGIIETSSGNRCDQRRDQTHANPHGRLRCEYRPAFVLHPAIADFVIERVTFVTTSAGSPTKYTAQLKSAGLTVFHVVPTLQAALKEAVDAGVDGLIA